MIVLDLPASRLPDFVDSMRLVSLVCDAAIEMKVPSPMLTGKPADIRVGEWRFVLGCGVQSVHDGMDVAPFEIRVFKAGVLYGRSVPDGPIFQFPEERSEMFDVLRLVSIPPTVQA